MPRMRNRGEVCPYCNRPREVTVNLDTEEAVSAILPGLGSMSFCIKGDRSCIEELRDKALLSPFADGKTRVR